MARDGCSEMRSAAPAIQGGGQADQMRPTVNVAILPRKGESVTFAREGLAAESCASWRDR